MKQSKITFLTSLGAALEYYDFVIYVLLASFISQQFFPASSYVASLFATFGVFAIGNIVRPLGGIIFGIFGDRVGRKNVFANTLLWMALATFVMGITPTFKTIGLTATIIFSLCRIIQGITCGAEIPGAATFLLEHINEKRHGLYFGFMVSAVGLGVSLGSFVIWSLTKIITTEQMYAWGFRIPFLLGGFVAIIGFFIRKHAPETPAFLAAKKAQTKPISLFNKTQLNQIAITIGILILPACLINFYLVLPVYLHSFYHYDFSSIYLVVMAGHIWSAILLPILGWYSDYVGRKKLLFSGCLLFILLCFPIFALLEIKTFWSLISFVLCYQTIIATMAASYFVLLPQSFPTSIRYTATAFSYNIAYTVAALIPLIATYFFAALNKPHYMLGLLMSFALLAIFGLSRLETVKIVPAGNSS